MKLKTAALLACIGTGITLLMQIYAIAKYCIINRNEYMTLENDINFAINFIGNLSLLVFFIVYYNKQNTKSWKD